ncbi:MAG: endoribonuclease MazF [Nostocales cyanobacterium]|nr:MAG: endoribonuclease MazF [Nostocales cyanobacterium]
MVKVTGVNQSVGKSGSNVYVPDRGDIVWLYFDPQAGHEQAGNRPALVISPMIYNEVSGLAIVCPITNSTKDYPFEVPVPNGINTTGFVLADHIKSVDWKARKAELKEKVSVEFVTEVISILSSIIPYPQTD